MRGITLKLLYYGLQRSGTNYLLSILNQRYKIQILNCDEDRALPSHKHFRLYDDKSIVPEPKFKNELVYSNFLDFENNLKTIPDCYIILSKDPYSWLVSYEKWARKCNWPEVRHHYLLEYNLFYGKWLEFAGQTDKIIFVRYVDLLKELSNELIRIEALSGIKRLPFFIFRKQKISKVPLSSEFTEARRNYYIKKKGYQCSLQIGYCG